VPIGAFVDSEQPLIHVPNSRTTARYHQIHNGAVPCYRSSLLVYLQNLQRITRRADELAIASHGSLMRRSRRCPCRTVIHDCQVIRRITIVIASPISGSAISAPNATRTALATTPSDTNPSVLA
jgi:hypothetical protein